MHESLEKEAILLFADMTKEVECRLCCATQ